MAAPNVLTTSQTGSRDLTTIDGQTFHVDIEPLAGIAGGTPYVYTLEPAGAPKENVYTTSNALYSALAANRAAGVGGPYVVAVVGGAGAVPSVHWTADGAQDLTQATIASQSTTPQGYTLIVDDGAQWTIDTLVVYAPIRSDSHSAVVTVSGAAPSPSFLYILNEGEVSSSNVAMFHATGGGTPLSVLVSAESALGGSGFGGSGTEPVITADAGTTVAIILIGGSSLFANSLAGAGTFLVFTDASSTVDATQPALTGTLTVNLVDAAALVAFAPAIPGNWNPPPANVAAALDDLNFPSFQNANAAAQGPAHTVTAAAPAITRKRAGVYQLSAMLVVQNTNVAQQGAVGQWQIDGVPFGPTQDLFIPGSGQVSFGFPWVARAPDAAAHVYSFLVTEGGAGADLQVQGGEGGCAVLEA